MAENNCAIGFSSFAAAVIVPDVLDDVVLDVEDDVEIELALDVVDDAVCAELVLDICCICIRTPRIILDRFAEVDPVRPPSVAAVVDWVEVELSVVVVDEEVLELESSRLSMLNRA